MNTTGSAVLDFRPARFCAKGVAHAGTMSYRVALVFTGVQGTKPIAPFRPETRATYMSTIKAGFLQPEGAERIRCVIADDHEMLRYGLRRLLEDAPDFAVVGEARDAAEALKLVLAQRPNMVLLDIGMPGMSSFEVGHLIAEHCADTRIVYLAIHEDREYVEQAFHSGASGYLLKNTSAPLLLQALREAHRGERRLSPRTATEVQDDAALRKQAGRVPLRRSTLTVREREVMKLLAEGHTVKRTAALLGVSVKTVEAHKFNLMRKLDIHNKVQLVTVAIQKKILPSPIQT
jgi:DNA-binding NarL/FixJ family response regulator